MILKTKDFKPVCSSILGATDANTLAEITETLELIAEGKNLYLNVTNGEYFATRKFELETEETFHATVKAELFLKLIDKITTETVELETENTYLLVKANGNYKLPFIMQGDKLLTLPKIQIINQQVEMPISYNILNSIANYNSKSIADSSLAQPVQKLYYIDNQGCMTYSNTACVNTFNLEKEVSFLLNDRIVKLFRLFKDSDTIQFKLGIDSIEGGITQNKISFQNSNLKITAIINSDENLLKQVKVNQIRNIVNQNYVHNLVFNKDSILEAVNRLVLFNDLKAAKTYTKFKFNSIEKTLTIYDMHEENCEILKFENNLSEDYEMTLDIVKFAKILENSSDKVVNLSFGNHQACIIKNLNIKTVIREVINLN